MWGIEGTDEFQAWYESLDDDEVESVNPIVDLLAQEGTRLGFPHSSGITTSRHTHMRELRIQHQGRPYRILYAFDPRRMAILLLGGDKTGDDQWYARHVPIADRLYDRYLDDLRREGLL